MSRTRAYAVVVPILAVALFTGCSSAPTGQEPADDTLQTSDSGASPDAAEQPDGAEQSGEGASDEQPGGEAAQGDDAASLAGGGGYPQHVPQPQLTHSSIEHLTHGDGSTYWNLGYPGVELAEAEAVAEQLQEAGLTLVQYLPSGILTTWFFDLDGQLIELAHTAQDSMGEPVLNYRVWE